MLVCRDGVLEELPVYETPDGLVVGLNRLPDCDGYWYRGCLLPPGQLVRPGDTGCCMLCGPITLVEDQDVS